LSPDTFFVRVNPKYRSIPVAVQQSCRPFDVWLARFMVVLQGAAPVSLLMYAMASSAPDGDSESAADAITAV
jgi:hypothetical protein